MFTKTQLDQLQKLLESNNQKIKEDIKNTENILRQEIQVSNLQLEERLNKRIESSNLQLEEKLDKKIDLLEKKLNKKIDDTQEDEIEVISELINTGFNMHEKRIKRIESHLDL